MFVILYAAFFVVIGAILGLLILAWWVGHKKNKLSKGEELDHGIGAPVVLSLALLLAYVVLGHGSVFNDFEVDFLSRIWMAGLGIPVLMAFLFLLNGLFVRNVNREIRQREERDV